MKRRFDIRKYTIVAIIVTVVMYVLSTFVFNRGSVSLGGVLAGLAFLAANAVVVYMTVDFFSVGINHAAPLIFATLALSFPAVAMYDASCWYALAINIAFYLSVRFYGGEISNDMAFFYSALLGVASLMFPPAIWLALFLLLMNFWLSADKARFVVMSLAGFVLPLVVYLAVLFATGDIRDLMPAVSAYLGDTVTIYAGFGAASAARVIKVVTIIVCFVVALVAFLRRSAEYSVSHSHAMIMVFAWAAAVTLLMLLFSNNNIVANTTLIMVPVSIVLYDYMVWGGSDRDCRIALAFVSLAVLLEYAFFAVK